MKTGTTPQTAVQMMAALTASIEAHNKWRAESNARHPGYGEKIDRLFDHVSDFTRQDFLALADAAMDQAGGES